MHMLCRSPPIAFQATSIPQDSALAARWNEVVTKRLPLTGPGGQDAVT